MRILLLLALLGMTAACVPPPAPGAAAPVSAAPPSAPVALVPPPAPPVTAAVAVLAPPPPGAAPPQPNPLAWLFTPLPAPFRGRVTLSNFNYDDAHVQAVITPYADCEPHPGTASSDFAIPLNGTRIIAALPGTDVCWRRELPPGPTPSGTELVSGWTGWSRVFTASGRAIDSQL